ncbi:MULTISPECIES: DUF4280 domain-containing protein [Brevibacillus]|jgi:hypothetical protein|uniref:DUF4280 domain-containing protein n=1 Tax=Brevibacillus parabrevis TaxID=54914 RepID=A0A4Y3PRF3_BREPA|nr:MULTISPECIES: DUF4280 domain-containing protein [Brevibacillus]TGU98221.1 DUF4280 domain-containing protein [Mesorhizobium sp. M00.F.Ca.ET.186.01.1.1]MBU8714617.1 DUF4280 domain-containing protein [Brevibacillus parabrevis]MDH6353217.1 hypothetical protein [Brevibacillus sp. 1238]MDR5002038.1 DUF4280 domain-containing protein [Brevibacillus parabrevis]MED2254667.1 DUF4280 domain-containing protein [Brevibacillus parabrevis]
MLENLLRALSAGIFGEEYSYVVRGATAKCSQGTDPGVLNLPTCHGVYSRGKPVMNVADHASGANIGCFGFCKLTGSQCVPQTPEKWTDGKEDVLVDNEPALLSKSRLVCTASGIITIDKDGQD